MKSIKLILCILSMSVVSVDAMSANKQESTASKTTIPSLKALIAKRLFTYCNGDEEIENSVFNLMVNHDYKKLQEYFLESLPGKAEQAYIFKKLSKSLFLYCDEQLTTEHVINFLKLVPAELFVSTVKRIICWRIATAMDVGYESLSPYVYARDINLDLLVSHVPDLLEESIKANTNNNPEIKKLQDDTQALKKFKQQSTHEIISYLTHKKESERFFDIFNDNYFHDKAPCPMFYLQRNVDVLNSQEKQFVNLFSSLLYREFHPPRGANCTCQGRSIYRYLVMSKNVKLFKAYLERLKDDKDEQINLNTLDLNGISPLLEAVARGHLEMIQFLVENGARPENICRVENKDGLRDEFEIGFNKYFQGNAVQFAQLLLKRATESNGGAEPKTNKIRKYKEVVDYFEQLKNNNANNNSNNVQENKKLK